MKEFEDFLYAILKKNKNKYVVLMGIDWIDYLMINEKNIPKILDMISGYENTISLYICPYIEPIEEYASPEKGFLEHECVLIY